MRWSQEWAEIGKRSENKAHGTSRNMYRPGTGRGGSNREESEKTREFKQNQEGVASQMPSEKRISGRRELLRWTWAPWGSAKGRCDSWWMNNALRQHPLLISLPTLLSNLEKEPSAHLEHQRPVSTNALPRGKPSFGILPGSNPGELCIYKTETAPNG